MKKLFILLFTLLSVKGYSQFPINSTNGTPTTTVLTRGISAADSGYWYRTAFADTTALNRGSIDQIPGVLARTSDNSLWLRNNSATGWIQLFINSPTADTLVWKLSGNTIGGRVATPVFGTLDGHDINFITNGSTRLSLPSGGLARNSAATTKYLTFDTITKQMYYADAFKEAWGLTGNSNTTAGTNFIGTTDAQAFQIRTNNTARMTFGSAGNLDALFTGAVNVFNTSTSATRISASNGTDSASIEVRRGSLPSQKRILMQTQVGTDIGYLVVNGGAAQLNVYEGTTNLSSSVHVSNSHISIEALEGVRGSVISHDADSLLFNINLGKFNIDSMRTAANMTNKGVMTLDSVTGRWEKISASSIVTATPTLQQVLTAGSTLTGSNTINGGGFDLSIANNGTFSATAETGSRFGQISLAPETSILQTSRTGAISGVTVIPDSIFVTPHLGRLFIDTLANLTSQNTLLGWRQGATQGQVGYVTIGSGLSLASGVLTASGGGVTTLAAIGSSANANGATISGSTLNLEPASASFGGVVTTGTQTMAGAKTFTGAFRASSGSVALGDGTPTIYVGGIHTTEIIATGTNTPLTVIGGSGLIEYWSNSTPTYAAMIGLGTNGAVSANIQFSTYNSGTSWQVRHEILNADGSFIFNTNSNDQDVQIKGDNDVNLFYANGGTDKIGIGTASPGAWLQIKAGTATATQAPLKFTTGTLNTTPEVGSKEYNNAHYETNNAINRYALGGPIKDFIATVDNGTTVETDLFTYTTKASTLAADGEKLVFELSGTFNDLTATAQLQFYYGGNNVGNTGALTVSATGGWSARVIVIRTGASTARSYVTVTTPGASTALYTTQTDITGLTFTNTQILKCTGTAAGASGGTGDISAKLGFIEWKGSANN